MPDAIVCAADIIAIGALQVCHQQGIDVPGSLTVTGFDDIEFAKLCTPQLTTVRQPLQAIAQQAVKLVLAESDQLEATARTALSPRLVERSSSNNVPGHGRHGVNKQETLEFLQELIRFESNSRDGRAQAEIQEMISRILTAAAPGLVRTLDTDTELPWTLLRTAHTGGPMLLFACHVDTVPTGDVAAWNILPLRESLPTEGFTAGDRWT